MSTTNSAGNGPQGCTAVFWTNEAGKNKPYALFILDWLVLLLLSLRLAVMYTVSCYNYWLMYNMQFPARLLYALSQCHIYHGTHVFPAVFFPVGRYCLVWEEGSPYQDSTGCVAYIC